MQLKPTYQEKRKEKRTLVRTVKVNLQHDFNSTAVDRCFGTRQSLKKWDNIRAISSFESVSDAERKRTTEDEKKVQAGKKLPKNHVGKHISYTWDKCALEEEALKWNDKTILNWSEVGKRYNILDKSGKVAKNCGQIAKDYLLSREKNVFLFTFAGKDESKEVIRRKLKRVACDVSARKVKKMLTDELESGKVSIGHSINPKKYLKFTIKNGIISTTEFTAEGRKHTLK